MVLAEEFTGTWCRYCPGAARGLDQLKQEETEGLVVIAYHFRDAFECEGTNARVQFYNITGYPTVCFDGGPKDSKTGEIGVIGGMNTGTMYSYYEPVYDQCKAQAGPVDVMLFFFSAKVLRVSVTNISDSAVHGWVQSAVIENNIHQAWQNMTELDFVCRTTLPPDGEGETLALAPQETRYFYEGFTLGSTWNVGNCRLVSFVQSDGADNLIYQAVEIPFNANPINLDGNGTVDQNDWVLFANHLASNNPQQLPADFDGDGATDAVDLVLLATQVEN